VGARSRRSLRAQAAVPVMQLAHGGRKASTLRPWEGRGSVPESAGGWPTIGPSAEAFGSYDAPRAMDADEIAAVPAAFAAAARRGGRGHPGAGAHLGQRLGQAW